MHIQPDNMALARSVPPEQREAVLRVLEFECNPTEENAEYVCEVMDILFKIKQEMKEKEALSKRLDEVIKFAIRKTADRKSTKQFFDIKAPLVVGKIEKPVEMLSRLMQIFDDPMDFSSCIEFNYNHLLDLMGEKFVEDNSDIISVKEFAPAVYMQKLEPTLAKEIYSL